MNKFLLKGLKWSGIAFIAFIVCICLLILSTYVGLFGKLPGKDEIQKIKNEEASLVFTSDSVIIGKYFAENRTNVEWNDLPDYLVNAVISTEDKRFYSHKGIDKQSYLRVFLRTILMGDQSSGGGSTITQQLAKNIYGRKNLWILTIPVSKIKEAILAKRFETVYSKEDILLLYLNSVPFGENVFGIEAASNRFFNTNTNKLTIQEAAALVGLLKANTYYNPRINPENAINRRNIVLQLMRENEYFTNEQADSLCNLPLELHYSNLDADAVNGYFIDQVRKKSISILESVKKDNGENYDIEKDGLRIYSTLDSRMQEIARKSMTVHLEAMQILLDKEIARRKLKKKWEAEQEKNYPDKKDWQTAAPRDIFEWGGPTITEMTVMDSIWHYYKMLHAAVLIAEPSSGVVLAWLGGNNFRYLPYDLVLSKRQAASSIKPLIYAAALENGMDPCTYLDNSKNEFENYKDWRPANYDNSVSENVDIVMWYALAHSVNLSTIDLYFRTGHDNVKNLLSKVGIDAPQNETPAISIGAIDVSLYQMVKAYCAFANNGNIPDELVMVSEITDAQGKTLYKNPKKSFKQAFSELTSEEITAMLQRAIDSGTGRTLRSRYGISSELAGKTGTSQNYSDAWFIAYTPGIVIGTWVGSMSPKMHFQSGLGSGSALALPICGGIIKNMESKEVLERKYLLSFQKDTNSYTFLDCDPFRQKGFKRAFDWLFKKDENIVPGVEPNMKPKKKKSEPEEKEKKNIFKRLFRKKDKENK